MKIKTQLFIAFSLIAILVPIYSLINYYYLSSFQATIATIINSDTRIIDSASDLSYYLSNLDDDIENTLLVKSSSQAKTLDVSSIREYQKLINKSLIAWEKAIYYELDNPNTAPEVIKMLQQRVINYNVIKNKLQTGFDLIQPFLNNKILPDNNLLNRYFLFQQINTAVQKLTYNERNFHDADLQQDQIEMYHLIKQTKIIGTFLFLLAFLGAFYFSARIGRLLTSRLNQLNKSANAISKGDYSVSIIDTSQDELGTIAKVFNKMVLSVRRSQQYIEKIIQTMPNIFILTSSDLQIMKVNHTAQKQLGYSEDELLKMNFKKLLVDTNEINKVKKNTRESYKTKLLCKNSKKITVVISAAHFIFNKQKEEIYIAQDVSLLQTSEEKMLVAAREVGMSEIATSVLHNVGNVLNSINASIDIIREEIALSKMENLNKLSDLMQQHKDDIVNFLSHDSSALHLPQYLLLVCENWNKNKEFLNKELTHLKNNVIHINEIIHAQQSMNILAGLVEEVSIVEILQSVLILNKDILQQAGIEVTYHLERLKKIVMDRVKLMQILVNLVKNSIDSLLESKNDYKSLKLELMEKNATHFIIQISDNGLGILPENILKVFTYGFTTKRKGHGFGLHTCANSAKEMGGSLSVVSEGFGKGAMFILELPYESK